jgi:hypothetical protein
LLCVRANARLAVQLLLARSSHSDLHLPFDSTRVSASVPTT